MGSRLQLNARCLIICILLTGALILGASTRLAGQGGTEGHPKKGILKSPVLDLRDVPRIQPILPTGSIKLSPVTLTRIIKEEFRQFGRESITVAYPSRMILNGRGTFQASLKQDVLETLKDRIQAIKSQHNLPHQLVLTLTSRLAGGDFRIDSLNEQQQVIIGTVSPQWAWEIQPLRAGTPRTHLTFAFGFSLEGKDYSVHAGGPFDYAIAVAETASPGGSVADLIASLRSKLNELDKDSIDAHPPSIMAIGKRDSFRASIKSSFIGPVIASLKKLKSQYNPPKEPLLYVKAKLTAGNCKVDSLSDLEQPIISERSPEFAWEIEPIDAGRQIIHLSLSFQLKMGEEDLPITNNQLYEYSIPVKESLVYRIRTFVSQHPAESITIITALIIPTLLVLWRWIRGRYSKKGDTAAFDKITDNID
jgi:hypothetical protein